MRNVFTEVTPVIVCAANEAVTKGSSCNLSQMLHVRAHHPDQIFMAGQFDAETTREAASSRSEDKRSCVA